MLSTNRSEAELYRKAVNFKLNETRLRNNGFPRPTSTSGKAIIYQQCNERPQIGNKRQCAKCRKEYTVDSEGFQTTTEKCVYHNKRIFNNGIHPCCNQGRNSVGCIQAKCHVYEYMDYKNLMGFVQTKPSEDDEKNQKIFAIDCEMCYTNKNMEPTKITVVDINRNIVYETYIKPLNTIVEYNEIFSGINEEVMKNCTTTLDDVHAKLLEMCSDKTILVGHSLDHDLKKLNLVHDSIIDTSILYPHKNPQYKRALRTLAQDYLGRIIQDPKRGHDSAEDALACMDLLLLKLGNVR